MSTNVIRVDGIDHWVRDIVPDGSSEGVDYDIVYVFCRIRDLRFKRPVLVLDGKVYAPVKVDAVPQCLVCMVNQRPLP